MRWKHLSRLESGALTVRRVQLMRMMSRISEVSAGGEDGGDVHELAGAERGPSAVRRRSSQGRDMWGAEVPNQPDWHLTRPARAVLTVGVRRGAPQTVDASGNVSQSMIIHEDESRPETAASADTGDLERLERRGSTSLERRGSSAPFGRLPAYASGGGRPGTASEFGRHAGPGIPEEQGEGEGEGEGFVFPEDGGASDAQHASRPGTRSSGGSRPGPESSQMAELGGKGEGGLSRLLSAPHVRRVEEDVMRDSFRRRSSATIREEVDPRPLGVRRASRAGLVPVLADPPSGIDEGSGARAEAARVQADSAQLAPDTAPAPSVLEHHSEPLASGGARRNAPIASPAAGLLQRIERGPFAASAEAGDGRAASLRGSSAGEQQGGLAAEFDPSQTASRTPSTKTPLLRRTNLGPGAAASPAPDASTWERRPGSATRLRPLSAPGRPRLEVGAAVGADAGAHGSLRRGVTERLRAKDGGGSLTARELISRAGGDEQASPALLGRTAGEGALERLTKMAPAEREGEDVAVERWASARPAGSTSSASGQRFRLMERRRLDAVDARDAETGNTALHTAVTAPRPARAPRRASPNLRPKVAEPCAGGRVGGRPWPGIWRRSARCLGLGRTRW